MRHIILILTLPTLLFAQDYDFELVPDAFPVEIDGWQPFAPWAGGIKNTTPEFCDIDADGDFDLFSGHYNHFWFFENTGIPSSSQYQYISSTFDSIFCLAGEGSLKEPNIIFADIDNDGDQDAITSVQVLGIGWNEGTTTQRNFLGILDTLRDVTGAILGTVRFELADIDADGDLDLFTEDWSPSALRFYENIGDAQNFAFQLITENWQNLQAYGGKPSPCFSDLDADGDLDLLIGTAQGNIYHYINSGDCSTAVMTLDTSNYFGIDVVEDASPELVDIDNDGDLDLFVGRSPFQGQSVTQGSVFYYENVGTSQNPIFQYITSNYLTWDCGYTSEPRMVDIDNDGDQDLVSSIGDRMLLYRNTGTIVTPLFTFESDSFENIILFDVHPWFCDIDNDGDYDLLAGESAIPGPPGLHLYINRGTPEVPTFVLYSDDLVPGIFTTGTVNICPWTADIDNDGDEDLFVRGGGSTLYYFENTGTASTFQFEFITNDWQGVASSCFYGIFFGCFYDIDDDDDFDLFVNNTGIGSQPWEKNLLLFRNTGTPESPDMQLESEDLFPELMIWQAAPYLCDMDQDGDGDMFVGDTWGGIRYFENIYDSSAISQPRLQLHPLHGTEFTFGPNPANPSGVASFELRVASFVNLGVYDVCGRLVAPLVSEMLTPGAHQFRWDAAGVASGVYLMRLENTVSGSGATPTTEAKRVVILR